MDTTADTSCFTYEPLDWTADSIRLLKIEADLDTNGLIACTLLHTSTKSCGHYYALSYMWGSEDDLQHITINGKPLPVRENLWSFLWYVRSSLYGISLWVDALCIDQNSINERGHQVALMHRIYSNARKVLVWLGSHDPDLGDALCRLDPVNGSVLTRSEKIDSRGFPRVHTELRQDLQQHPILESVAKILTLEYWSRLWIVQELLLARSIELVYGGDSIGWNDFWSGVDQLVVHNPFPSTKNVEPVTQSPAQKHHEQRDLRQFHLRATGSEAVSTLWQVLSKYASFNCMDIRDRVYGVLSLVSAGTTFTPDYGCSSASLVIKATAHFSGDVALLALLKRCLEHEDSPTMPLLRFAEEEQYQPTKLDWVCHIVSHRPDASRLLFHFEKESWSPVQFVFQAYTYFGYNLKVLTLLCQVLGIPGKQALLQDAEIYGISERLLYDTPNWNSTSISTYDANCSPQYPDDQFISTALSAWLGELWTPVNSRLESFWPLKTAFPNEPTRATGSAWTQKAHVTTSIGQKFLDIEVEHSNMRAPNEFPHTPSRCNICETDLYHYHNVMQTHGRPDRQFYCFCFRRHGADQHLFCRADMGTNEQFPTRYTVLPTSEGMVGLDSGSDFTYLEGEGTMGIEFMQPGKARLSMSLRLALRLIEALPISASVEPPLRPGTVSNQSAAWTEWSEPRLSPGGTRTHRQSAGQKLGPSSKGLHGMRRAPVDYLVPKANRQTVNPTPV